MTPAPRFSFLSLSLQPLTEAEAYLVEALAATSDRTVVMLRGAGRLASRVAPFGDADRLSMFEAAFPGLSGTARLAAVTVPWTGYDAGLAASLVAGAVSAEVEASGGSPRIGMWGFSPQERAAVEAVHGEVAARPVPSGLPQAAGLGERIEAASPRLSGWMEGFVSSAAYEALEAEERAAVAVLERYGSGPHLTADAVCVWRDRVLVVRRGNHPFRGALALPGGVVDPGEDPSAAAARELLEEAGLPASSAVRREGPPAVYRGSGRDPRGDYVAHVFTFDFSDLPEAPVPVAGDDAAEAMWAPLESLAAVPMAFDHQAVLHDLLGSGFPGVLPREAGTAALRP